MTSLMKFQTVSDVLDYVLFIRALLVSYAFKIFDQDHIIINLLYDNCMGRIKATLVVRIDHDLKMSWNRREV